MPIDLEDIKGFVEDEIMVDTCTITRNEDFTEDEDWDPVTMEYSGGDPDTVVYGPNGKCYFSTGSVPGENEEGGQVTQQARYYVNIPIDAPAVKDGDIVTATSSLRDPLLVDETFIVRGDEVGTHKVKRRIIMTRVKRTSRG